MTVAPARQPLTPPTQHPLTQLTLRIPPGALQVLVTPEDDVVRAAGFGEDAGWLVDRLAPALRDRGLRAGRSPGIERAVSAYADGDLTALDAVAVDQPGGPFLSQVWRVMRDIAPGTTVTYTELAQAAGRPAAVRAAGQGCARNLIAPFVPCHRVVRSDGTFGGYAYGIATKVALLEHERRHTAA